jgi:NAD(P)-dependent dehydrogenase (short-subunit alcohol dehydrogenase family)
MSPSAGSTDARHRLFDQLFDLTGQVALVTGGAGRLGREYARTLADAGAQVAVLDLPGSTAAADLVRDDIHIEPVNIVDRQAVHAAMSHIVARLGVPTILVNNAGLGASPVGAALENGPFEDYPEVAWDAMIDSHLKGAFFVTQAFLRSFRGGRGERGQSRLAGSVGRDAHPRSGSIINVSSTYGVVTPDQSLYEYRRREGVPYFKPVGYSVAKSGVLNFTRWLAEYCAPFGVRVNTLVPGGVREEGHAPEFVEEYEKRTPLGRMAVASDYNGAVLFLASPASSYMTGAMVVVDGGWTAR